MSSEDAESIEGLVERAQAGDMRAFERLYRRTSDRVYALCLRMSGDGDRAHELVQDVFVRVWEKLASFRGDSLFTTWLHRLTVNVVLQDRRSRGRREAREVGSPDLERYGRVARRSMPGTRVDLERAIAALPDKARQVLVLRDVEGYKYDEIAKLTGVSLGTVKAQIHPRAGTREGGPRMTTEHLSIERMNEALDGLLASSEHGRVLAHVEVCGTCRNEYARLSETVTAIASLPSAAEPPSDTWHAIAARIEGGEHPETDDDVPVFRLPTAGRGPRRFTFSVAQLAAAAALVAVFSASLMWLAIEGGRMPAASPVAVGADTPGGAAARAVALDDARYQEVVSELERILAEGRDVLTQETLVSIEQSLTTIDEAMREIEAALADDPNSDLLLRMLANHRRTRLGVLQRAAEAVQAQT